MNRSVRLLIQTVVTGIALAPVVASAQGATAHVASRDQAAELACGARAVGMPPDMSIRIAAGRERGKALFGPDEALVINAGTARGIKVGQEYYVRRVIDDRFVGAAGDNVPRSSIHTAGWVRIEDAQTDSAIATVVKVCDAIQEGDYLELFVKPTVPASAEAAGEPDFANPGHLVLGDERRQMAAAGDLMVLDRGSDHGLRAGQHLTVFRTTGNGTGPIARVAEATVVVVSPETSTIRIDKTSDAVNVGDLVAIHR
jgi:hypothetical protein